MNHFPISLDIKVPGGDLRWLQEWLRDHLGPRYEYWDGHLVQGDYTKWRCYFSNRSVALLFKLKWQSQ